MKYQRITVLALAAIFMFTGSILLHAIEKPAGMIVKVDGDVTVQRGDKQKKVKSKCSLMNGDMVLVGEDSSAVILFATGKKIEITSDTEITDEAAEIEAEDSSALTNASKMMVESVSAEKGEDLKTQGGVGGVVRGKVADPSLVPVGVRFLSYLNTSTINTRPVIAWETGDQMAACTLVLMNEEGETVWKQETDENIAAYPEDRDPLKRGVEYTAEVTCEGDGEQASEISTFYVLGEEEAAEVRETVKMIMQQYSEDDDIVIQHMLLANYFKEKELYNASIDEWKKLVALDAYDTVSLGELAGVYREIGDYRAVADTTAKIEKIQDELGEEYSF